MLYEWLLNIATQRKHFEGGEPKKWNPQLVQRLKNIRNLVLRVVDFWVDSMLEGYITEFVVETITSYSEVGRKIFQGPRGRYLIYLRTWIKILLYEKGIR